MQRLGHDTTAVMINYGVNTRDCVRISSDARIEQQAEQAKLKKNVYFKYTGHLLVASGTNRAGAEGSGNLQEPISCPCSSLLACIVADQLHPLYILLSGWKVLQIPGLTVKGLAGHTDWTGSSPCLIHTNQLGHFGCTSKVHRDWWDPVRSSLLWAELAVTRRWSHFVWIWLGPSSTQRAYSLRKWGICA